MAVVSPSSSLETLDPKPDKSEPTENPNPNPNPIPNPEPVPSTTTPSVPPENPNPVALPPPAFAPSFRPLGMPPAPHYSAVPNPNPNPGVMYQGGIQPPGVSIMPPMRPGMMYPPPPYGQVPNGYMAGPPGLAPPGIPRYPGPYPTMVRPGFPPRPMPPMGVIPQIPRPPIPGVHGIPSAPMVRPVVPIVAPTEKPQTTVYVGKISPSADNDFLLSLLRLCGPVKSWKRAQDPTDGTPKGFGFCEFEAAEGVLRALRLLTKLSIDGQELVLNINQATREYLERYVEKKTEREKLKETESKGVEKENESAPGVEKQGHPKPDVEETKKEEDSGDKEIHDNQKFGIVTDEDCDADRDALEKLTSIIEERIKNRPLPPPPPVQTPVDTSAKSHSEIPSKSRDGDSDVDIMRSAEDKNDDETTSEAKAPTEHNKPGTNSPDRSRRHDRRSRERDRERDLKRDKERELERYERERERERVRRERERDMKIKEGERLYRDRVKDWEDRERDRERHRRDEKEREKERQRKRQNEILKDEDGSDDEEDDGRNRRRRSSMLEEKRRKRQREKEDDLHDRLKEEEEIAEAKKRAIEEQKQEDLKPPLIQVTEDNENVMMQEDGLIAEDKEMPPTQQAYETITSNGDDTGDVSYRNSSGGEFSEGSEAVSDAKQNEAPTKKLGFGLVGSGKRTTVPSVFHEEEDENVDDKKMRPLVPIDYSTEELQAVQTTVSSAPANLVAAAEFAKRISGVTPKEEKPDLERERNGRSNDRTGHRERDRKDDENTHYRNESKEKNHNRSSEKERGRERDRERDKDRDKNREDKPKTENRKLLDAKQLIDMIPKTKEELFAYEINWAVYDKHELHERMRPWISKKITEFLGEEEATLVDYIVSSTKEHVQASKMLELLQSILDDEAEMFVLKMWREKTNRKQLISHRPISVSISKSMANTATKISTFAVTCGLLSQYVKEKGARSLGDLGFSPLAGKSDTYRPPPTMSLLPGMEVSADISAETKDGVSGAMELFPQRAGLGLNGTAGVTREPEKAQLTIFYGGKVLVFDNFPSDKASDLMQLACKKSCTANNIGVAPPTAAAASVMTEAKNVTSNQSTTPVSAPTISLPIIKTEPQKAARGTVSNVPMARKASLHRFLEKRNDRINAKAPYQVKDCPSKDSPVDSAKADGSQPWLGLKTKPET